MKNSMKLLCIFLFLICNRCLAQNNNDTDYKQFVTKFTTIVPYPGELMSIHKPTVCLIKIQTDSAKNILNMQLSDSADSLLKVTFNKNKGKLELNQLKHYLKSKHGDNNCTTYLIPLSYAMNQGQVPVQTVAIKSFYEYQQFNGINVNERVIFLDPIYSEFSIPQQ